MRKNAENGRAITLKFSINHFHANANVIFQSHSFCAKEIETKRKYNRWSGSKNSENQITCINRRLLCFMFIQILIYWLRHCLAKEQIKIGNSVAKPNSTKTPTNATRCYAVSTHDMERGTKSEIQTHTHIYSFSYRIYAEYISAYYDVLYRLNYR